MHIIDKLEENRLCMHSSEGCKVILAAVEETKQGDFLLHPFILSVMPKYLAYQYRTLIYTIYGAIKLASGSFSSGSSSSSLLPSSGSSNMDSSFCSKLLWLSFLVAVTLLGWLNLMRCFLNSPFRSKHYEF